MDKTYHPDFHRLLIEENVYQQPKIILFAVAISFVLSELEVLIIPSKFILNIPYYNNN